MNADDPSILLESVVERTESLLASLAAGEADANQISNVLETRADLIARIPPGSSLSATARTTLRHQLKLDQKLSVMLDTLRANVRDRLAQARRHHQSSPAQARLVCESA